MTTAEEQYRRATRERALRQHRVRLQSVAGVHAALRSSLRTGLIEADERLDEHTLVDRFSVSRSAVRAALGLLVEEGIVSRSPRAGTVVRGDLTDVRIDNGVGWSTTTEDVFRCEVLERRWVPATPLTRHHLSPDAEAVHLTELVLLRHGGPALLYARFSLSGGVDRRLTMTSAETASFGDEFARVYGSPLGQVGCWLEAVEADEKVAAQLEVPVGTALLVKSRVLWSADGVPREFSVTHYPATHTTLSTEFRPRLRIPVPRRARTAVEPVEPGVVGARQSALSVHAELRAAVREGLLPVGDRLNEQDLADRFGVSRNSIRRGLAQLADEGVVRRAPRTGTVIERRIADLPLDTGRGWHRTEAWRYRAERLAVATVPTPPFLSRMLSTSEPEVAVTEYRILRDGRPFGVYLLYSRASLPHRPLSTDSPVDFDELFARTHGSAVDRIDSTVHAVRADGRTARLLDVSPGTLLLLRERVLVDEQGRPCEFSHGYFPAADLSLSTRTPVRGTPAV
ncbi:GntR family transcriptional regulator [Pseudonocardia sp. WMMC193]|uniref:GntR family transcriptional regulator n=1 Tax=Pseudonocardia sp. WMMC193 TaxID=2911965 RepID=UPI001F30D726|nr:GntR family transcriptional regulator [Pseudonocardia sp. WMMC193]MCF7549621.1 GntR family transcriptional regulator [Pseudonocardia sp. WMMC193]